MMWGVHIFKSGIFETLISFIISQNKQIPHIKQIVAQISKNMANWLDKLETLNFTLFLKLTPCIV